TREDPQAPALDGEVVLAGDEVDAPQLQHLEAAAGQAILRSNPVELDDAVGEALQLSIATLRGAVVEEEHGGIAGRELLLEGQDLPAVAERVSSEESHLRERIDDDPLRPALVHDGQDPLDGLVELDLGRMEERVLALRLEHLLGGGERVHVEAVDRPAVRDGDGGQLLPGLRQRDVETGFVLANTLEEKLEAEGGLAHPWAAPEKVGAPPREPTAEDLVQSL